ncbi:hypothetical protein Dimus_035397, partial [Dionaea muscipula]
MAKRVEEGAAQPHGSGGSLSGVALCPRFFLNGLRLSVCRWRLADRQGAVNDDQFL